MCMVFEAVVSCSRTCHAHLSKQDWNSAIRLGDFPLLPDFRAFFLPSFALPSGNGASSWPRAKDWTNAPWQFNRRRRRRHWIRQLCWIRRWRRRSLLYARAYQEISYLELQQVIVLAFSLFLVTTHPSLPNNSLSCSPMQVVRFTVPAICVTTIFVYTIVIGVLTNQRRHIPTTIDTSDPLSPIIG